MNFLDLIFPPSCEICGKIGTYLCESCYNKIKPFKIKKNTDKLMCLYSYEGEIRTLMIQYKFNDKSYLDKFFAELIIKNKKVYKFIQNYDIITPVPVHKKRKQERGYNQSELIIKQAVKKLKIKGISIKRNALIKTVNNKPQSTKNVMERKQNVKNVFEVANINEIAGKRVLIFDDIYTTGNTIKECRKELIKAGAKKVGALTVARKFNQNMQKKKEEKNG